MLEIPVSFLVDEFDVPRRRAVAGVFALVAVSGTVTALRPAIFGFVAGTLVDVLLTTGLIAFLLFVGWVLGRDALAEYESGAGALARRVGPAWLLAAGGALPLFLSFSLLTSFGLQAQLGFWGTVAAAVAVAAAAFLGLRRPESMV
jgi:NSS family neurotransmitter:Na+ symporter